MGEMMFDINEIKRIVRRVEYWFDSGRGFYGFLGDDVKVQMRERHKRLRNVLNRGMVVEIGVSPLDEYETFRNYVPWRGVDFMGYYKGGSSAVIKLYDEVGLSYQRQRVAEEMKRVEEDKRKRSELSELYEKVRGFIGGGE